MSHLRDTALLTQGSKDSATPSQLQEPFLMEQLPREMQCQFILKPSRLAMAQQLSGELLPLLHRTSFQQKLACLNTDVVQRQRPNFHPEELANTGFQKLSLQTEQQALLTYTQKQGTIICPFSPRQPFPFNLMATAVKGSGDAAGASMPSLCCSTLHCVFPP